MNKMKEGEFEDRVYALQRARKIFNNLTDKNITKSFEAYQKILAENPRPVRISTKLGNRKRVIWDNFILPRCPHCHKQLAIQPIKAKPGSKANRKGWKTIWFCNNETCYYEKFSKKDWKEWIKILGRKTYRQGGIRWRMETFLLSFLRRLYILSRGHIEKQRERRHRNGQLT